MTKPATLRGAIACALTLALSPVLSGCADRKAGVEAPKTLPGEPIIDDECPRADGRPCQ